MAKYHLAVCLVIFGFAESQSTPPNLLLVVADDLGWNDVGYNNPDVISPTLDSLANGGVILDQNYVNPLCTPSRAALMTGYYAFRQGLQHLVIFPHQDVCVPDDKVFLPQILKQNGYVNHIVGKWHLGYCKWECTPTYKGFDSFYGSYIGAEDYYRKAIRSPDGWAFDFRINETVGREAAGNYSAFQFADRTDDIIRSHDQSKPLFLYLSYQNIHMPVQVPAEYVAKYPNITDKNRQIVSGMITAMDDALGQTIRTLKDTGLYDNTIIIFMSDNGGWTLWGGNNYPLRGGKMSLFEGGTRVPAFIHSPLINATGQHYKGMVHAVDWFPTILEAVGINYFNPDADGVSQWTAITTQGDSPRTEFVYNIDLDNLPASGVSAVRVGDYKLMMGYPGAYQDWYRPGDADQGPFINPLANAAQIGLNFTGEFNFLFNLKDDPEERHNLYDQMPQKVSELQKKLADETLRYVKPNFPPDVPASEPINFGMVFSPGWC